MAKKKISLDIEESMFKSLARRFPDIKNKNRLVASIATLAITEWEAWFSAQFRPKTITSLSQERIRMIYGEPSIYAGKQVTRGVLFNQFNLPYGEATYIERVFAELDLPTLCLRALRYIGSELSSQLKRWKSDKTHDQDQSFTIEVNKYGQRLLQTIMQQAKENDIDMAPEEKHTGVHGYYTYTFTSNEAEEVVRLCADLEEVYKP